MLPNGNRRQDREREFHDLLFSKDGEAGARSEAGRFYGVVEASQKAYADAVTARARGSDCLEYGCSFGQQTIRVSEVARSAAGFDISPVVIQKAREAAEEAGASARFDVAEAESLPYSDSSLDLAFGNSVLHHLELRPAMKEMARVLRPSGSGVFSEPLGHNPLINWYRNRTPSMRTPDEHPLVRSDFELFREYFDGVTAKFFHLAALGAVILSGRKGFQPVLRTLDVMDRYLLRAFPPLRYHAWVCVIVLEGPRKL